MTAISHGLDVGRDGRPLPRITSTNRPYWEATRRHELMLPRCPACKSWAYPISTLCPSCEANDPLVWEHLSGNGDVSSWVVYHRRFDPFTADDVPYAVLEVELLEGPRLIGATEDMALDEIHIGVPVRAVYRDVTADVTLVLFTRNDEPVS
jgi:uncharacterized OB-fold protein